MVGGGVGGATVARYLSLIAPSLAVTLIEPKRRYTTCFFSNLYLAGLCSLDSLTHDYQRLARRGIDVIEDLATDIDPVARKVRLSRGNQLGYDRLVVAPGISFRPGAIANYDAAAQQVMPHAWMGGPQDELLRRQLEAMPDGGVFLIVAPPEPFRCPPGPYERASMVAAYFKQHKPRSKIVILDAKDTFFEQDLFEEGWNRHYPGMVEWLPGQFIGRIERVDARARAVVTENQTFTGSVVNVIPAQMAAELAQRSGLCDASGWCPVDPATFASTLQPGIHVVGDASKAGAMPKSAFAANSQAKACAFAIAADLGGRLPQRAFLYNTCYTFLAPDDAISDAISFKVAGRTIEIARIMMSDAQDSAERRARNVREAKDWYGAFSRDVFG